VLENTFGSCKDGAKESPFVHVVISGSYKAVLFDAEDILDNAYSTLE
jgi:hypothetical protein